MIKKRKGLTLIAAVILILFASTAILGLSFFITGWIRQVDSNRINTSSLYLAQAGIHNAIYQMRSGAVFNRGSAPVTDNSGHLVGSYYVGSRGIASDGTDIVGGMADYLMVNTAGVTWASGTRILSGITVGKVSTSPVLPVTIASVNVCYSPTNRTINQIIIGGTTWTGTLNGLACATGQPGNNANINPDVALTTSPVAVSLRWSNSITLTQVKIQFNMLDTSTKTIVLWPLASATGKNSFIINSTGRVENPGIYRTISAAYSSTLSQIVDIDEIKTEITTQ